MIPLVADFLQRWNDADFIVIFTKFSRERNGVLRIIIEAADVSEISKKESLRFPRVQNFIVL